MKHLICAVLGHRWNSEILAQNDTDAYRYVVFDSTCFRCERSEASVRRWKTYWMKPGGEQEVLPGARTLSEEDRATSRRKAAV